MTAPIDPLNRLGHPGQPVPGPAGQPCSSPAKSPWPGRLLPRRSFCGLLLLVLAVAILLLASTRSGLGAEVAATNDVPAGYTVIEGDILVPTNSPLVTRHTGFTAAATYPGTPTSYWTGGWVPYEFDANVSTDNRNAALAAMNEWQAVANVAFVPRNGHTDYLHIRNSTGNSSAVGRQGGQQIVNIVSWNSRFVIVHELGHALGFWHEQSRGDRDQFVTINWANIQTGRSGNFDLHNEAGHYGPYDFDSLMHYDQCSFSVDCPAGTTCGCTTHPVISVRAPWDTYWQTRIGQRDHLSTWDKLIMSFIYSYSNDRFVDWAMPPFFGAGTFFSPFNSFFTAKNDVPNGGFLWILRPGNYSAGGTHSKPMTISAPTGGVTLVN